MASGQNVSQQNLIAESQTGASTLFFSPRIFDWPVIQPSRFNDPKEYSVRLGLPNFFKKMASNKTATIGYLGGSITRADNQYRMQSAKFIQTLFPKVRINGINAGVSGTGSDLGACRLYEQLLKYKPDLIFVEFAVNGAFAPGIEGIIRQIWKYHPKIDICLIYSITDGLGKIYAEGGIPKHIAKLDQIADHYSIPSIHLGMEAAYLEKQGKLVWKGDSLLVMDKIIFSADGVHPLKEGGNLYAAAIARAFLQMKEINKPIIHHLPAPLFYDNWEDAKMLDPMQLATFSGDWKKINPLDHDNLKSFSGWFPYLWMAEKPGASFSFSWEGTMFGIFDIGGPEVGQLEIELDGLKVNLAQLNTENYEVSNDTSSPTFINRFNKYCNNRYRGQCAFVNVSPGKHHVKIFISTLVADKAKILGGQQLSDISNNPQKYNRSVIYFGKILFRGNTSSLNKSMEKNRRS